MIADPNDTIVSVNALVGHRWQLVETSPHQANHSIDIPAAAFDRSYAALRAEIDSSAISMAQLAHEVVLCAKAACVDSFLSHLFHHGRYPPHSLNNALLSYIHSLSRAGKSQSSHIRIPTREDASIAQQMLDVVGSQLQAQEDATTGALREEDFVKAYKLEFMKVLALAEESKRNAKVPLSLSVLDDSSTILVFAKAAVAAPVPTTVPRFLSDSSNASLGEVRLQRSGDSQEAAVNATYTLAQSFLARLRTIDGLSLAAFENGAVQAVTTPSSKAVEDVAVDLFQDTIDALIDGDAQSAFSQQLSEIAAIASQSDNAADGSAALVDTLGLALQDLAQVTQSEAARSGERLSDHERLFNDVVVQDAASLVTVRYEHAMAIFLVIVLVHNGLYEPDGNDDDEQLDEQVGIGAEDSIELLSRASTTLAGFAIARWICHHNIAMTNLQCELSETQDESTHGLLQRLQEMRMQSMNGRASGDINERNSPVSLLASLYTVAIQQMESESQPEPSMRGKAAKFLIDLGFFQHQAFSASDLAAIAAVFIEKGWVAETLQLLGLCPEKVEDAALLHLQAVIACRNGNLSAALWQFDKVAAAIYADDTSLVNLGEAIDAEDCGSRSAYYRLAVSLLEAQQPNLEVATASIKVIESFDEENPDAVAEEERPSWLREYWTKAFRNYTAIGMYEEAFTIMMSIPQRSHKLDALRHLTAVMCESGATGLLLRLSFVDMQEDMQTCLSFRARNAHPLAEPDYHTTLHAFQCMMNDYRGAAATMYQKARRLAALPVERDLFIQVLTTQCQSYLSAITVLELLESHKQSIQVNVEGTPAGSKKRKRQRLLDSKMQDGSVVTLEAIRREYVLTLARLQLSQSFPDLVGTGKHLDARAAVALFTQIGAFDSALRTALALRLDMSNIFEHLTLRCISYSQQGSDQGGEASWVLQDSIAADWEGSLASRAWKLLQVYLERYDMDGQYRRTVLSVILVEDRRIRLPKSLVDWFMAEQPDHLIWKLVQYDLLEDAFVYTFRMLEQASTQLQKNINSRRSAAIHIPYNLLDQLLHVNMEGESVRRQQAVEEQQKKLRQEVDLQWRRMDQVLTVL